MINPTAQSFATHIGTAINTTINMPVDTPWGRADHSEIRGEGIAFHATPSHGGFHLDPLRNAKVHEGWRNKDAWYEEDVEWAKIAFAFPELFSSEECESADQLLRDYHPDAYEAVTGIKLRLGQSYKRETEAFAYDHRSDWLMIAAISSRQHPGFVECIATIGGERQSGTQRRYLVSEADYATRVHAFVVDPQRHQVFTGPSSFVGWR